MTIEEKALEGISIATAPLRWAMDLLKLIFLFCFFAVIVISYPLYLYFSGDPVSANSLIYSGLVTLLIFTMIYTPGYMVFLVILSFVFYGWCGSYNEGNNVVCDFMVRGWNFEIVTLISLLIGIAQRFIFKSPAEPRDTRPPAVRLAECMNRRREGLVLTEMLNMGPEQLKAMKTLYGENPLMWPLDSLGQGDWRPYRKG